MYGRLERLSIISPAECQNHSRLAIRPFETTRSREDRIAFGGTSMLPADTMHQEAYHVRGDGTILPSSLVGTASAVRRGMMQNILRLSEVPPRVGNIDIWPGAAASVLLGRVRLKTRRAI